MWEQAELAEDIAMYELAEDISYYNDNDLAMCYNNAKKKDLPQIDLEIIWRKMICECGHKFVKSKKWKYYCNNHCYL